MTASKASEGEITIGVGDGSGQLFVHGDFDSIAAVRNIILRLEGYASRCAQLETAVQKAEARAAEAERKLAKCSGKCADLHSEVKGLTDMRDAANGMRDHALKRAEAAELDAGRLVWAMSHMNMPEHHIAFSSHVLSRGGTGDHSDCATYIDAALRWSAP